tara:strand:+ start:2243 stop:2365 length:123 start_codon:yes stop_codon:yes gene_type:complete
MENLQIVPLIFGITISILAVLGLKEIIKEASTAFRGKSHA